MSRKKRKELIEAIQEKRGSRVITYVTGDRPNFSLGIRGDIVPIIHEHMLSLGLDGKQKVDLFIYSRGGDSDAPWSIVSMFREYCKEGSFSVLIPFRAHSAATLIALGADEIVMTKKSELGPIDITIQSGPYNPTAAGEGQQRLPVSVEDVMGYFSLLDKVGCSRPEEAMRGFELLTQNVHPLVLGTVSRLLEQTQLVALRLLSTRAEAFTEERNREIVQRLSSEIYSHRHTISRTEALDYLGLEQVVRAEDVGIDEELWGLYKEYEEFFTLDIEFQPEDYLLANGLDNHVWKDLNLICVESLARMDVSRRDIEVKRNRQMPPQVALNINGLSLPPINLPNLPAGMSAADFEALMTKLVKGVLDPVVNTAVKNATDALIKSLPHSNFSRVEYNKRWDKEV